ncbi:hypothetical protein CFN78_19235 [Amycolatopsis antarctica]|uniref:ANTAR domain-containing protein n=1 Tax=Amycolatopsis antarctica TaxID=1854586 RepID=A0A263CZQ6_9PSEU|nr:GAF and ANTAR domain-containing protein [Amycolatopsis antarctica]OZM71653.1 hypothetical protein CFN78_19235 [Amycolatopsis antarctica]
MSAARRERLSVLLDAGIGGAAALPARVCALCVTEIPVTGAALTIMGGRPLGSGHGLVHATGPEIARVADLHRTVGEGPCHEAYRTGGPVLVPDMAVEADRWPGFAAGAAIAGVAAVFSFPLQVGSIRLGVLDLHRDLPGPLDREQLADALFLAEVATVAVLDDIDGPGDMTLPWLADIHAAVHQASGIVTVQLGVGMDEALLRIRGHAFANQQTLDEVARQIVARELRLEMEQ